MNWTLEKLGALAELTVGHVGTMANQYESEGVPFLRSLNVKPHRIDPIDLKFINPEFARSLKKSRLRTGDVVTVRTGAPGQTAVIPHWLDGANCSDLVIIRPREKLHPKWLSYHLNWITKAKISQHLVGAVQQHFNVSAAASLSIQVPPISYQRAVAEVLGALDDKIAANERILDLRQQLTRSIYRSAPKPRTKPLSSVASFINGRAFTKNATGTGRVVIRIAELNSGVGASTVWNDIDVDKSNTAQPGDLLFAWSGSLTVARWFEPEAIVNQHIFKVETRDETPMWLVRELLNEQLERFKSIAADKATTMGHIKRSHLDEPVHIPDDAWLVAHQDVMSSVWDLEFEVELEKRRLARTRDELLPLLMSGKITVKDAEAVVSDAV
ncbi:restriction endonuclease subunit S [Brevibacterium linens]|uniref:Type I restriction enzyme, S subunit n=1 Tax=Brevibacterium linens TaxID=1703 RepID=A0A2H1JVB6_BRELN|nr:restriction endonuclease subunit S [Brevibacterium linens]SMX91218.1 type I restriction enzyme, S subunit [Brevibacterium linens]